MTFGPLPRITGGGVVVEAGLAFVGANAARIAIEAASHRSN